MTATPNKGQQPNLQVTACANAVLERYGVLTNDYLVALSDGRMSKEVFRTSQEQFYFAVKFFSRPMCALVGRIPDPTQRLDILKNVVEEHGEFSENKFHQSTFVEFLTLLGSDISSVDDERELWPEVRAFNTVLAGTCLLAELEVGIACMGIIELAFASISATIGSTVVARNWISREDLTHYSLHAELDIEHANEFFQVIEASWDSPRRIFIEQGLSLGAYTFKQLYESLYSSASEQHN